MALPCYCVACVVLEVPLVGQEEQASCLPLTAPLQCGDVCLWCDSR